MDELLELIETAQDPESIANAITDHQQSILETIQDAIPIMLIAAGIIIGIFLVKAFSGGMRNAS